MKLTQFSIREIRLTLTIALFTAVGGIVAFFQLPRSEDPKIPFRYALITTVYPGASSERMESFITVKLEEAIKELPEIEMVNSVTRNSACGILVKIKDEHRDLPPIWNRMRRKIERTRDSFPEGVQGPFLNDEYGEVFGIIVTIAGEGQTFETLKPSTEALRQQLLQLDEVAKVLVLGDREEAVFIEYDDAWLTKKGLSPLHHLRPFFGAQNVIAPGGSISEDDLRIPVEPVSELRSVVDVENLYVSAPGEDDALSLYELDSLEVRRKTREPPNSLLRSSGLPGLGLAISMRKGGNIERLGKEVSQTVEAFSKTAPSDLSFDYVAFEPDRVKTRIYRFFRNFLQSLVIVMVILVLTLGLRTGTVVAIMMPLVVMAALAVMHLIGLELNLVALAAFIVVLGIMVDNHIVISERVLRLREEGKSPEEAAVLSTGQLYSPLLTATVTTLAGFLPLFLARSSAGEYVSPLFNIISITLICSTIFAFTVTPALSVYVFKVSPLDLPGPPDNLLYRSYRRLLCGALARPRLVIALAAIAFTLAIFGFRQVPSIFFPPSDRPIFTLEIELPPATSIEKTAKTAAQIDRFVAQNLRAPSHGEGGVTNWASLVGRNAPRFILNHRTREYNPEYAYFIFNVASTDDVPGLRKKLKTFAAEKLPQAMVRIRRIEAGPAIGFPIRVQISGEEVTEIKNIAKDVKEFLGSHEAIYNLTDDWGPPIKKYKLRIDEYAAGVAGVTHSEIAATLQTYLTGIPVTEMYQGNTTVPVFIRSRVDGEEELQRIRSLNIYSILKEKAVPLGEVAEIREMLEPANIIRRNFRRTVSVLADVHSQANTREVEKEIEQFLATNRGRWGERFDIKLGGEGLESSRANRSILVNLHWAGFIIVLLLINQTRSFRRTFIILSAVPMGIIGVSVGLLVTRLPFGFTTLVGMVALTGIVINNAIILIDRIRVNTDCGELSPMQCIVEAGLNRLRPILLTTITTVGGVFPLYLSGNPTWQGMAAPIIFGLIFATVLVLVVVPSLYAFLFRIDARPSTGDDR